MAGIDVPASEQAAEIAAPLTPAAKPTRAELARAAKAAAEEERKAKADAKKKPKEKPEPARIWVQVAGGANEKALPTAWNAVVKQAPAAFKGRVAYTTPLRATNRVLTGPFKSDDEAQEFVNKLRKEGIATFQFNSDPGQKIFRLGEKGPVTTDSAADDDDRPTRAGSKKTRSKKGDAKAPAKKSSSSKKRRR